MRDLNSSAPVSGKGPSSSLTSQNDSTKPFAAPKETEPYFPKTRVRFITAASLFDGHDASINIMRRILQASGAEVIHLGHNQSAQDIVNAAIQEDVNGIAISSYQGGHVEFFKYTIDLLKKANCSHIKVFGGGGGTITGDESRELEKYGVGKVFSPEDGRIFGLQGMINFMLQKAERPNASQVDWPALATFGESPLNFKTLGQVLTCIESNDEWETAKLDSSHLAQIKKLKEKNAGLKKGLVIGMTGTGGAGKSSLTDELILRLLEKDAKARVAVLAIDPTRKKTGGALLGDRLRMNALKSDRVFMRSMATRDVNASISRATREAVAALRTAGFDWIILETSGIGQADTSIVDITDLTIYVMTSEFGAPTQLEKINMLDYASLVVLNKFEKSGSLDALNDIRKQFRRNHREFEAISPSKYPIFGTIASRFGDPGVTRAFEHLYDLSQDPSSLKQNAFQPLTADYEPIDPSKSAIVPRNRTTYLNEIAASVRNYHQRVDTAVKQVQEKEALEIVMATGITAPELPERIKQTEKRIDPELNAALHEFEGQLEAYRGENFTYQVRNREIHVPLTTTSLSQQSIRKVSLPRFVGRADRARFAWLENLPGYFPFTAGVFPFKRAEEDPKRQFAGEGTPDRTNRRFHLLCAGEKAKRLSTAFDSVSLYGHDPDERPDIYGKIGESGVAICSLDDMKKLYRGFDLCDPNTSVSMTINGPAPMMLAFFFNTAIDQQVERFEKENGRVPSPEEHKQISERTLRQVRGTVQADILKEDQAQNTCIFSTEFALRMMGDIQQFFIDHEIKNYYSVSISGYHIAEAGANPITQLAFTLANGFTFAEYYRNRGMKVDDFVPNFSFFFSNGLDPEYTVIGRVARRVWAIAMKSLYGGNDRSQKLKYHIQTSGRSLHAQEISFNDIRTTLQALIAFFDNCNSLHTNAYDEAVTTPTEESVRRAMAIQLIIAKELGWAKNENPLQGSFFIEELTDLVEEALCVEFERLGARGGVLGAMESHYQRSKIQDESLYYETLKHNGQFPIIGVNTYLNANGDQHSQVANENLTRATDAEKQEQISNLRDFCARHKNEAPGALQNLKTAAQNGTNLFTALLAASRVCSLGQMTRALYDVGGEYRRGV